jgi:hypothetical protein
MTVKPAYSQSRHTATQDGHISKERKRGRREEEEEVQGRKGPKRQSPTQSPLFRFFPPSPPIHHTTTIQALAIDHTRFRSNRRNEERERKKKKEGKEGFVSAVTLFFLCLRLFL